MEDELVTHLGPGWSCGYCGEFNPGPMPAPVRYFNFEDLYVSGDDDDLRADSTPEQIASWVKAKVETWSGFPCPGEGCSGRVDEDDCYQYDDAWQCNDCKDIHESQEVALDCCEGTRNYLQEREAAHQRNHQQQIAEAHRLLESQGFVVTRVNSNSTLGSNFPLAT